MRFACLMLLAVAGVCGLSLAYDEADRFPEIYNNPSEAHLSPMPAKEASRTMELPDGFRATVFAAEPDVQNPIAMTWDKQNRLWVAENFTYADRKKHFDLSLRDRVLIFEDTDHDGRADSRKVFTDDVQMLTSVEVGRGGVWLMCPSQLLFIPNADGDDTPDGPPQVVLDGFKVADGSYHNFANGLKWGPDGWLYGRCGHSCPGRIGVPGTPDELRIPIDGGIWRYHPREKIFEVLCHGTVNPWGHDWDNKGELFFVNTVIGHLWHVMPGAHFKESFGESMNPGVFQRMDMIADHYHYDRTGSWSASRDGKANSYGGGHAHIGATINPGNHWPETYHGKLFTINMHGKRANVEQLERQDAGYIGRHNDDFFISRDPFFRGLDLNFGPDGNMFIIDWSDTGECHEHTGVHRTSGRIYKISYGQTSHDGSTTIAPVSKPSCLDGDDELPKLWRQYQRGETTPAQLRALLSHPNEHVRVWAIRLLTDFWPLDTIVGPKKDAVYPNDPQSRAAFVRMAKEDQSGLVHLALASTLHRLPVQHRAELAREFVQHSRYASDRDLPHLVWYGLIPVGQQFPESLIEVARQSEWPQIVGWSARLIASQVEEHPKSLDRFLEAALKFPETHQQEVLTGLSRAFHGWHKVEKPSSWDAFAKLDAVNDSEKLVRELSSLFGDGRAIDEIRQIALNKKADMKTRQQALKTLIKFRPDDLRELCESLVADRGMNATALSGLVLFDDRVIGELLAKNFKRFHPDDRGKVIEALVSRRSYAQALLETMQNANSPILPADINAFHARQIHALGDEQLTETLGKVWGDLRETPEEKRELIATTKRKLDKKTLAAANLSAGRALFQKTCATCHRLYGEGKKVGPDITGAQRNSLDYILQNILDPSAVVGKDYRMSIVITDNGRVISGLISEKTDKTISIQTQTSLETIPVGDVDLIKQTTQSPMPDGLLEKLTDTQIRDLVGYLMHPVQVPLPETDDEQVQSSVIGM